MSGNLKQVLLSALVLLWHVASARPFTASDLVTLREVGVVAVSPNGRWVAWDQRETDLAANEARARVWVLDPHRNEWMMPEIRSRMFVMSVNGGKATSAMGRWLGDARQGTWAADGKTLFYTLREARRDERFSLNRDIIASRVSETTPTNLTGPSLNMDALPAASPDGRWLAYVSAGTLQLRDLVTGTVTSIADDWDATVRSVAWAADSRSLLVTARVGLDEPLFQISLDGRNVIRLTEEGRVANVISLPQGGPSFHSIRYCSRRICIECPPEVSWRA